MQWAMELEKASDLERAQSQLSSRQSTRAHKHVRTSTRWHGHEHKMARARAHDLHVRARAHDGTWAVAVAQARARRACGAGHSRGSGYTAKGHAGPLPSKMVPFPGYRHVLSGMHGAPEANSPLFVNHSKVQFRDHAPGWRPLVLTTAYLNWGFRFSNLPVDLN